MAEKSESRHELKHEFVGVPFDDKFPGKEKMGSLFDLTGKTAIVTGAAHGLGMQIALALACFGADVIAADVNDPGTEETASMIKEFGRKSLPMHVDIADWKQVQAMVSRTVEEFGKLDICFNIPGINIRKAALNLTPEEYDQVIKVNLTGIFHCAKAAGEIMVRQKSGKVINMSSIYGICGAQAQSAYASSKGGIIQLTKALALEWAAHNVQVNAIAPGYHMTLGPLAQQYLETPEGKAMMAGYLTKIPQGRMAHASEIIGPAIFLASGASNYVTGTVIVADGGWTAQ